MIKHFSSLLLTSVLKPVPLVMVTTLVMFWSSVSVADDTSQKNAEIAVNVALETARKHVPGKVIAHEMADETVGEKGAETLQPVYKVKILSTQGVMKTLLVHRKSGEVVQ